MIIETARRVKTAGAKFLRGLAGHRPTLSRDTVRVPWGYWRRRKKTGLGIITEVMDASELEKIVSVADGLMLSEYAKFSLLKSRSATKTSTPEARECRRLKSG